MAANDPFDEPKVVTVSAIDEEVANAARKDLRPSELLNQEMEAGKNADEKPLVPVRELFQYADCLDKVLLVIGGVAGFFNGATTPAFSEVFGRMVRELSEKPADVENIMADLAVIMVYLGIVSFFLSTLQVGCYMISASRQITRIQTLYFDAVVRQEMAWHDEHQPGALAGRLSSDCKVVREGINDKLSSGIYHFGLFVFGYGFGFYRSWELTLVMSGTMPLVVLTSGLMIGALERMSTLSRVQFANASDIATEAMSNVRSVQVYGTIEKEVAKFAAMLAPAKAAGIKKEFASVGGVGLSYGIVFSSCSVAFWFASYLIEWGRNDVGDILAVFYAVLFGSFGLGLVFPSLTAFTDARAAAFNIFSTINRTVTIDVKAEGKPCDTIATGIEFRNVAFSYPTRKEAKLFTDLNLTIERGQKVAFTGSSGCGKSSIASLLQRFYDPDSGSVLVDGIDMKELSLKSWRGNIGVVSQETTLFSGSIAENVRVGKPDATLEEVIDACTKANIHDTVMMLPDEYDTQVGAIGSQLSGGQKQRLAIARAIIKHPQLLILDEATSALDRESEMEVQVALEEVMTGPTGEKLTVFIIAHRLATIMNVDVIHHISRDDEGGSRIVESGSFTELIERQGEFAHMAASQAMADDSDCDDDDEGVPLGATGFEPSLTLNGENSLAISGMSANISGKFDLIDMEQPKTLAELAADEVAATEVPMKRIIGMVGGKKWAVFFGFLGSLVAGGMYPTLAVVFSQMFDVFARNAKNPEGLRDETPLWASMFIVVGVATVIGWLLQGFYAVAGEELTEQIRVSLLRRILHQDATFFDTPGRDSGALTGVLAGDTEAVHQLFGPSIGYKIQTVCNIAVGVTIAMIYSWKLALVVVSVVPAMVITGVIQQMLMKGFDNKSGVSEKDAVVGESLNNISMVTSFNIQGVKSGEYSDLALEEEPTMKRNSSVAAIAYGLSQLTYNAVFALAFWYGGKLMASGELQFIDVMTAATCILLGARGAGEAGGFSAKVADAEGAAKRVFAILDRKPAIDDASDGKPVPETIDLVLKNLRFVYPARPGAQVLRRFSTKVKENTSVGLVGGTGCGKSTIIHLLCRFYDPASGSIQILGDKDNAVDLRDVNLQEWRQHCAVVSQEPALFSGTIRENIIYGLDRDVSDEEIHAAAALADLHEVILDMPDQYDTDVGYKGRRLSGGQKQRVAIARALLRRPSLLLLDEATSALDAATESRVMKGIAKAAAEHPMSVVSVAHRLTTIDHCDNILLLERGKVLEKGNHQQLMARGGEYKKRYDHFTQNASE